jgi:hypothetical protein
MNKLRITYGNDHWIEFKTSKSPLDVFVTSKAQGFVQDPEINIIIPFKHVVAIEKI